MKRNLIQLTPEQEVALRSLAAENGTSLAGEVRNAVECYRCLLRECERVFNGTPGDGNTLSADRRLLIVLRDHFRCVSCGLVGIPGRASGQLQVHHQEPGHHGSAKLVTLCTRCHKRADAIRRHTATTPPRAPVAVCPPPSPSPLPSSSGQPDEIITSAEATALLKVSGERLRFLIRAGRIPAVKTGRDWLMRRADIDAFERRPKGWQKGKKRSPP